MKKILFVSLLFSVIGYAAPPKRIAAVVTEYRHNSHADVIVSRLLLTHTLDEKGERPNLKLVSLYTDQVPKNDTSRKWAAQYGVPIYKTVEETLTLGTGKLYHPGHPRNGDGALSWSNVPQQFSCTLNMNVY